MLARALKAPEAFLSWYTHVQGDKGTYIGHEKTVTNGNRAIEYTYWFLGFFHDLQGCKMALIVKICLHLS